MVEGNVFMRVCVFKLGSVGLFLDAVLINYLGYALESLSRFFEISPSPREPEDEATSWSIRYYRLRSLYYC